MAVQRDLWPEAWPEVAAGRRNVPSAGGGGEEACVASAEAGVAVEWRWQQW